MMRKPLFKSKWVAALLLLATGLGGQQAYAQTYATVP